MKIRLLSVLALVMVTMINLGAVVPAPLMASTFTPTLAQVTDEPKETRTPTPVITKTSTPVITSTLTPRPTNTGFPGTPVPGSTNTPIPGGGCPVGLPDPEQQINPEWLLRCSACMPARATSTPFTTLTIPTQSVPCLCATEIAMATLAPVITRTSDAGGGRPPRDCTCMEGTTTPTPSITGTPIYITPVPHYYVREYSSSFTQTFSGEERRNGLYIGSIPCYGNDEQRGGFIYTEGTASFGYQGARTVSVMIENEGGWWPGYIYSHSGSDSPVDFSGFAFGAIQEGGLPGYEQTCDFIYDYLDVETGCQRSWTPKYDMTLELTKYSSGGALINVPRYGAVCYGVNDPVQTPTPTATPAVDAYCSDYRYVNDDPAVIIGDFGIIPGECFTLLPSSAMVNQFIPVVVGDNGLFSMDWPEVQMCPNWVLIPDVEILGITIPLEIGLIPLLMFVVVALLRL